MNSKAILAVGGESNLKLQSKVNAHPQFFYADIYDLQYSVKNELFEMAILHYGDLSLRSFKAITCWVKSPRLALISEYAKENQIRLLNSDFLLKHFNVVGNKIMQAVFFKRLGIPFVEIRNFIRDYPFLLKKTNSSNGKSIELIHAQDEFDAYLARFPLSEQRNFFIQDFVHYQHDYRVLVLGGQAIGIIERCPKKGEFRANVSLGATPLPVTDHRASPVIVLAEKVASLMGIEYVGVDILSVGGELKVLEINLFANFNGFEEIYGEGYVLKALENYLLK